MAEGRTAREESEASPEREERERSFHDEWAEGEDLDRVDVRAAFESLFAQEGRFIRRLLGDLEGRRLLDVGCGLGEASVYFALEGAEVTACDLSPGMLRAAKSLAARHGTCLEPLECPADELAAADDSFDVVYAGNLLHHMPDAGTVLGEFRRVVRPGGLVVTWDPLAYNPVINLYRRMATEVRTEDEAPLRFSVLREYGRHFRQVHHREFWLTSLSIFLKYFLVDRVHPNEDRYWKRIYRPQGRGTELVFRPLVALDQLLLRLPLLGHLAWNTVIWAREPRAAEQAG